MLNVRDHAQGLCLPRQRPIAPTRRLHAAVDQRRNQHDETQGGDASETATDGSSRVPPWRFPPANAAVRRWAGEVTQGAIAGPTG